MRECKKELYKKRIMPNDSHCADLKAVVEVMEKQYNEILSVQEEIKKRPNSIQTMNFHEFDGDLLVNTKPMKDCAMVSKYYHYLFRYNNLVKMYNNLKEFITRFDCSIMVDFEFDKEGYPVASVGHYTLDGDRHKVYLLKVTTKEPEYMEYIFTKGGECKIIKIQTQELLVGHKSFMLQMLVAAVEKYNNLIIREKYDTFSNHRSIISKLTVDLMGNNDDEKIRFHNFFRKKDFIFAENRIYKNI